MAFAKSPTSTQPAPTVSADAGFSAVALDTLFWLYHTVPVANSTSNSLADPPSSRMALLTFPASFARRRHSGLWLIAIHSLRMPPWSFLPSMMFAFLTLWMAPCTRSLRASSSSKGLGVMGKIA